jgi:hypothetical protein
MGCADSCVSMKPAPANSLTETEPGLLFPAAAEQEECGLLPASTHTTAATHKHEVLVRPGSRLVLVLLLMIILWATPIQQTTRKKGFHKMKPRIECNSIFQTKKKKSRDMRVVASRKTGTPTPFVDMGCCCRYSRSLVASAAQRDAHL